VGKAINLSLMEKAKKIVIITEKIITDDVTKFIENLGASGYTLKIAGGKGSRGVRTNARYAINDANANVCIETIIVDEQLAVNIAEQVAEQFLGNYSGVVYLEDVSIIRPEKFQKD